jgi:hypothetical protein
MYLGSNVMFILKLIKANETHGALLAKKLSPAVHRVS